VRAVVEIDSNKPGGAFGSVALEVRLDNRHAFGRGSEDFGREDFPVGAGVADKCEKGGEKCRPSVKFEETWQSAELFAVFAQAREDTEVFERSRVAGDLDAGGNLLKQAAHDFAAASFW